MTTSSGLRERKKAATRRAVHHAALRLVSERGFDHVTVEDIADAAGVSRRTFFNYFADKADAVMYGEEERLRRLTAAVRARPAGETGWQALRESTGELFDEVGEPDRESALRDRLARRHPCLLARRLASLAPFEHDLAQAIAERDRDGGLRPRVLAAAYCGAVRVAGLMWLEEGESRSMKDLALAALDELGGPFA